jgi:hypothetical protein
MDRDLAALLERDIGEKALVAAHQTTGDQRFGPAHAPKSSRTARRFTIGRRQPRMVEVGRPG